MKEHPFFVGPDIPHSVTHTSRTDRNTNIRFYLSSFIKKGRQFKLQIQHEFCMLYAGLESLKVQECGRLGTAFRWIKAELQGTPN